MGKPKKEIKHSCIEDGQYLYGENFALSCYSLLNKPIIKMFIFILKSKR
ncbi:hypothetical protein SAMN05660903_00322 [Salegentibacter salinarum]|nr:hypothetical protein SAMN05660903_00322 [Salegentibacter salinarum]